MPTRQEKSRSLALCDRVKPWWIAARIAAQHHAEATCDLLLEEGSQVIGIRTAMRASPTRCGR